MLRYVLYLLFTATVAVAQPVNWKGVHVLVYTKNGPGYVHDNIPFAVAAIRQLGQQHGFRVTVADQPAVFTEETLRSFTLLIFTSTNNDVFDTDAQRLAFRRYVEAGGGFVGVHSVVGTERNWPWFRRLLGGTFAWHARFQPNRIVRLTRHPSTDGLPDVWTKSDECYFLKDLSPGPTAIMAQDVAGLDSTERDKIRQHAGTFGRLYPAVWHHAFDGGQTWCTTLGHDKNDYQNATFVQHLLGGIRYVASAVRPLDYRRAYATHPHDPLHYD